MTSQYSKYTDKLSHLWDAVPEWLNIDTFEEFTSEQNASIERYEDALFERMGTIRPGRFAHCISVGLTAHILAQIFDVDAYSARVAGILHDWDKILDAKELKRRAELYNIDMGVDLDKVLPLLHGPIAAHELPEQFSDLTHNVLCAISRHTFGAKDMSKLDMIIFIADVIEPLRKGGQVLENQRQSVCKTTLEDLYFMCLADGISYVVETRRFLYPVALDIYNELVCINSEGTSLDRA